MKRLFGIFLLTIPIYMYGIVDKRITTTEYDISVSELFPSPSGAPSDKGIENVVDYIIYLIPSLATVMAVGAVIMVVFGGFRMVIGGADMEHNEKGKSIIRDAIIGLLLGLLAYVFITILGNILDI